MNPLTFLKNPSIEQFILNSLTCGYSLRGISVEVVEKIVGILKEYSWGESIAIDMIYKTINIDHHSFYKRMYQKYKQFERPNFLYNLIEGNFRGNRIVDVGCGFNYFCQYLGTKFESYYCVGTDILDLDGDNYQNNVAFIHQKNCTEIPIDNNYADCIILANVLHHVNQKELVLLLKDVQRIQAFEGKIFIIEDSWDHQLVPQYGNEVLIQTFNRLTESDKFKALCVMDWIGTELATGQIGMDRPYTFNTIAQWEKLFLEIGFNIIKVSYLGFPLEKLHLSPQCYFIIENKK